MDINSLLSPDPESRETTPRSPSNPYASSPSQPPGNGHAVRPPNQPRKSSGLSQQLLPRYSSNSPTPTSTPPYAHPRLPLHKDQRSSLPSLAAYNAASASASASSRPLLDARMPSSSDAPTAMSPATSGMDALAEVASRQSPQITSRPHEPRSSTSTSSHTIPHRASVDSVIPDAPKHLAPP